MQVSSNQPKYRTAKIIGGVTGFAACPILLQRCFKQSGMKDSFIKNIKTFVNTNPDNTAMGVIRNGMREAIGEALGAPIKKPLLESLASSKGAKIAILAILAAATTVAGIVTGLKLNKLKESMDLKAKNN